MGKRIQESRMRDLRERASIGSEALIEVKITFVGEEDSHIEINGQTVFVATEDLLAAFSRAEEWIGDNIDGG